MYQQARQYGIIHVITSLKTNKNPKPNRKKCTFLHSTFHVILHTQKHFPHQYTIHGWKRKPLTKCAKLLNICKEIKRKKNQDKFKYDYKQVCISDPAKYDKLQLQIEIPTFIVYYQQMLSLLQIENRLCSVSVTILTNIYVGLTYSKTTPGFIRMKLLPFLQAFSKACRSQNN